MVGVEGECVVHFLSAREQFLGFESAIAWSKFIEQKSFSDAIAKPESGRIRQKRPTKTHR
jgi:hypothetical protein